MQVLVALVILTMNDKAMPQLETYGSMVLLKRHITTLAGQGGKWVISCLSGFTSQIFLLSLGIQQIAMKLYVNCNAIQSLKNPVYLPFLFYLLITVWRLMGRISMPALKGSFEVLTRS